jgi:hypothetical protein
MFWISNKKEKYKRTVLLQGPLLCIFGEKVPIEAVCRTTLYLSQTVEHTDYRSAH